jgi:enoyl-CoA hydratase
MDLPSLIIERYDGYAVLKILPREQTLLNPAGEVHWELGEAFSQLRGDNDVRVVVLTGAADGTFEAPATLDTYQSDVGRSFHDDPARTWKVFTGIVRCYETMVSMEKPIIARVNGAAIGLGQGLMFASDIIVARSDARIGDMHMAMGEMAPYGPPYGIVPGDGGAAFAPLYLSPAMAKEYLMLGREFTAEDFANWGLINYAVNATDLDAKTDEIVDSLLRRSSYALAWTKRVANRNVVAALNLTLDSGAAFEMVNLLQIQKAGFVDRFTL